MDEGGDGEDGRAEGDGAMGRWGGEIKEMGGLEAEWEMCRNRHGWLVDIQARSTWFGERRMIPLSRRALSLV